MGRQDYHWKHEPCLYGWKEGAAHGWYNDRKQTTVLNFERPKRNAEHPTMKPIPLIAYQMGNSSKADDIVCDGLNKVGEQVKVVTYGQGLSTPEKQALDKLIHDRVEVPG